MKCHFCGADVDKPGACDKCRAERAQRMAIEEERKKIAAQQAAAQDAATAAAAPEIEPEPPPENLLKKYAVWAAIGGGALVLVLIILLGGYLSSRRAAVAKESVPQAPTRQTTSNASPNDQFSVEFTQKMQDERKMHQERAERCKVEPPILSPASLENREAMALAQDQFEKCAQINMDFYRRVKELTAEVKVKVAASDLSASDQEALLRNFDSSNQDTLSAVNNQEKAEQQFIDSVRELYSYTVENDNRIRVDGNRVSIADPNVSQGYNQRFRRAKQMSANLDKIQAQGDGEKKPGLSERDLNGGH